ncbi:hypothetical protein [Mesorhizobium sp. M2A.F.Ca.ET.067.02.1.1]|uniref:hypothetical protein n=1 Tax=Mesorhizobium sp. M2A.F.Ca.ET.067.02.1.1 TaxID=2496749 RepID=UPI000FD36141|nr:hypothetical protein [Mesorhizobium sp. M2A.F.Ca.ET.067.02.1.1]RUW81557.1 hypothetical protein EOA28_01130 [Mesorhizobium sp. M2A.F.Ca.ET.067.02.1.1]TIU55392.1 MAG: hypothetical protein E5W35_18260 [Mesorhizobium sp.]
MSDFQSRIALAEKHVAKGRELVERQRQQIRRIGAQGRQSAEAEHLLTLFEQTLAIFEDDLAALFLRSQGQEP